MAKELKKATNIVLWLLGVIVSLAISGAFISGMFANVMILNYLPLIIHQIVGYLLLVVTIIMAVVQIAKAVK